MLEPELTEDKKNFVCKLTGHVLANAYLIDKKHGSFYDPSLALAYLDTMYHKHLMTHLEINRLVSLIVIDLNKISQPAARRSDIPGAEPCHFATDDSMYSGILRDHLQSVRGKYSNLLMNTTEYFAGVAVAAVVPTPKKRKASAKKKKSNQQPPNKKIHYYSMDAKAESYTEGDFMTNQLFRVPDTGISIAFISARQNEIKIVVTDERNSKEINQAFNALAPLNGKDLHFRGDCWLFSTKEMFPDGVSKKPEEDKK